MSRYRQGPLVRSALAVSPALGLALLTMPLLLSPGVVQAIPNPYPNGYAPQPMPGQSLLYPSAGVVCDQPAQRCYDSNGLSLGLTAQYFGSYAQQNALQSLGGRRPGPVFNLSNGSRCDVRQLSCWSTNLGQGVINQQLTTQLFGGMPSPGPSPAPSPYPAPQPQPNGNSYTALCRLMRSGMQLFNGACALTEVRQGFQPRFEVNLQNGPRYVFEQVQGGYQISDGQGGRWPVQFSDNGRSGQFRWADMTLTATQNNYRPESNPNARWGRAVGNFLTDLFN